MASSNNNNASRASRPWPFNSPLQRASLREPPAWSPELNDEYPFRFWIQDIVTWCLMSSLREEQRGPAIELALGGAARNLVREMDMHVKMNGVDEQDANGGVRHTDGVTYILRALQAHYGMDGQDLSLQTVDEWEDFRRQPGETIDQMVSRFEILRYRVGREGVNPPWQQCANRLMRLSNVRGTLAVNLLSHFGGSLPRDEPGYQRFQH